MLVKPRKPILYLKTSVSFMKGCSVMVLIIYLEMVLIVLHYIEEKVVSLFALPQCAQIRSSIQILMKR